MSETAVRSAGLSQDEVFTILKNPRRRYVIRYLQEADGRSTVRELTAEVAVIENDVPVGELTYDQRKAVYTSLYQTHLPKLDEAGVVEYDRRSGDVELADRVADCHAHLRVADGGTRQPERDNRLQEWMLVGGAHVLLGLVVGWVITSGGRWPSVLTLAATLLVTGAVWYHWYVGPGRRERRETADGAGFSGRTREPPT